MALPGKIYFSSEDFEMGIVSGEIIQVQFGASVVSMSKAAAADFSSRLASLLAEDDFLDLLSCWGLRK